MVKQKRPQPAECAYDCLRNLTTMPDAFWIGVPTAAELPHGRDVFKESDSLHKYCKQRFSQEAWDLLVEHSHILHPRWCKTKEQLFWGDHMGRHIPTEFATYLLNGTIYASNNSTGNENYQGRQEELYQLEGGEWHTKGRDYAKLAKDESKFNTAWNRLRKAALRRCGKEPDAKTAKVKALSDKKRQCEKKRKEVLKTAEIALKSVQMFVDALKSDTVDEGKISEVYFDMINLAEQNKSYKEVAGVLLKVK